MSDNSEKKKEQKERQDSSGGTRENPGLRRIIKIPTPWGPIEGDLPSIVTGITGALMIYLVLLYVALPNNQPKFITEPLAFAAMTGLPPTPQPKLIALTLEEQKIAPSELQYELHPSQHIQFVVSPQVDGKIYSWRVLPPVVESENRKEHFTRVSGSRVDFIAPSIPGTYYVIACEQSQQDTSCADEHLVLVEVVSVQENSSPQQTDSQ